LAPCISESAVARLYIPKTHFDNAIELGLSKNTTVSHTVESRTARHTAIMTYAVHQHDDPAHDKRYRPLTFPLTFKAPVMNAFCPFNFPSASDLKVSASGGINQLPSDSPRRRIIGAGGRYRSVSPSLSDIVTSKRPAHQPAH